MKNHFTKFLKTSLLTFCISQMGFAEIIKSEVEREHKLSGGFGYSSNALKLNPIFNGASYTGAFLAYETFKADGLYFNTDLYAGTGKIDANLTDDSLGKQKLESLLINFSIDAGYGFMLTPEIKSAIYAGLSGPQIATKHTYVGDTDAKIDIDLDFIVGSKVLGWMAKTDLSSEFDLGLYLEIFFPGAGSKMKTNIVATVGEKRKVTIVETKLVGSTFAKVTIPVTYHISPSFGLTAAMSKTLGATFKVNGEDVDLNSTTFLFGVSSFL